MLFLKICESTPNRTSVTTRILKQAKYISVAKQYLTQARLWKCLVFIKLILLLT